MIPINFEIFNELYQKILTEVYLKWNSELQKELAVHCYMWRPNIFDFKNYLKLSSKRFYKAYCLIAKEGINQRICDIGGFWGVFPITLANLGFDITMTETLNYYGPKYDDLFKHIESNNVQIVNYDPFANKTTFKEQFDFITIMAVLEHYPHSLKVFMKNILSLLRPDGYVYLEVPNIAYWPKRINLMFGKTPLSEINHIFKSDVPFIGHHHEFTMSELGDLASLSDLKIIKENCYNYSNQNSLFMNLRERFIETLAFEIIPLSKECLAILCSRPKNEE